MRADDPAVDGRRALEVERQLAMSRLRALAAEHDGIVAAAEGANLDDEHDPEGATVAFERARVGALLDQARRQVEELDGALARFDAGTYGTCAGCGRPIPVERLAARPATDRCVDCAGR